MGGSQSVKVAPRASPEALGWIIQGPALGRWRGREGQSRAVHGDWGQHPQEQRSAPQIPIGHGALRLPGATGLLQTEVLAGQKGAMERWGGRSREEG